MIEYLWFDMVCIAFYLNIMLILGLYTIYSLVFEYYANKGFYNVLEFMIGLFIIKTK